MGIYSNLFDIVIMSTFVSRLGQAQPLLESEGHNSGYGNTHAVSGSTKRNHTAQSFLLGEVSESY